MTASNFMETVVVSLFLTNLYFCVLPDGQQYEIQHQLYDVKQGPVLVSAAGAGQPWMNVQPGE